MAASARQSHVPFRNSELTKLLQPSIGGNSMTSIVCTVTPAEKQRRETRFTLDFGMTAKKIKNLATKNESSEDQVWLGGATP